MKDRFQQGRAPRASLRILLLTWMTGVAAWLSPTTQSPAQSQIIPTAAGAGTQVTETGDQYDIEGGTQAGGNLFHEFDDFSLTAAETANFVSDSGVFNIVGQVSAANPSYIDGTVQVSGSDANLYLVNPAGVLFGPDAQVSLSGSFSVTTADQIEFDGAVLNVLDNGADYSAFTGDPSAFHFTEASASAVVNQGDVTVAPGESISLIGGNVVNTGTLRAPGGEIGLVAVDGESTVRYGIPGSVLGLELTEGAVPNGTGFAVTNLPALLTGSSTPLVDELVLRSDGIYELNSLQIGAEEVSVAGEISTRATNGDGGAIALLGRSVNAVEAVIDASGDNGGNIRIGRDVGLGTLPTSVLVWMHNTSVVRADGLVGAGGDIAVGSTRRARVQGDISAQGTTLGGLVETSSPNLNSVNLRVDASGQAENGRWLVAPGHDIDIVSGATGFNQINPSVIESTLDSGTDIEITTTLAPSDTGDIFLSDSIAQNGGGNANLTLTGRRFINNGSTIDLSSTGQLTFEINQVNAESNPDSSSIENAISAIGNVNGERLINLGAGTYDFSGALDVNTQVEIQGADVDTTVLQDTSGDRIFNVLSSGNLHLQDVTLTKSPTVPEIGGGILNSGGSLTIVDSLLRDNVALSGGAINTVDGANLTVISSEFEGNQASSSSGGAISIENSTASIGSGLGGPTVFMTNMAATDAGAIQIIDSSAVVQGTLFEGNRSEGDGGAVGIRSSLPVQFEQVTFESNESQGDGGAVALWGQSEVSIADTVLFNNRAAGSGGAVFSGGSTLDIINSWFDGNSADNGGGLQARETSILMVEGSRFTNNSAISGEGGGISVDNSDATLQSVTVSDNTATVQGGGVAQRSGTLGINTSEIRQNGTNGDGGGIVVAENASLALGDTIVQDNRAVNGDGGGLLVSDGASATVTGVLSTESNGLAITGTTRFEANTARLDGGGIASHDSARVIVNGVLFQGNIADDDGGGLAVLESSRAVVENSNFENNYAAGFGGGLFSSDDFDPNIPSGDIVVVDNSRFINNEATVGGGYFQGLGGTSVVSESLFWANQARFSGGGIYGQRDIMITDAEIIENVSNSGGGILAEGNDANFQLSNTTLESNRAVDGGGLFNRGGVAELTNTTFSNNVATNEGGGIKNTGANAILTVRNSTVYENEAGQGGGILASDLSQTTRVLNTIVAGNVVTGNVSTAGPDVSGHFEDQGNNLIGSREGTTGFANSVWVGSATNPIDPRLAPLADNGGLTRTHAPLVNSVAIDAGKDVNLPAFDQRGLLRVSGSAVDIGAVELSSPELANIVPVPDPSEPTELTPTELTSGLLDPTISTTGDSDPDVLLSVRKRYGLDDADAAIRRLEQFFSQGFEDYWDLSSGPDLTFSQVQAILRRAQDEYKVNSAVVYAIFSPEEPSETKADTILQLESPPAGDDLLNLSVVMPEGELVNYQLPVTRNEVVRQVRYFRSTVSDPDDARGYQPLAQQLYQWLLAPLEADLAAQNVQNLMYALDAGLRTAPIAAMRDYEGFSLERYGLSVVPTMGLIQADFPISVRRSTVAMGVSEFTSASPLPAVPIELQVVDQFVPVSQTLLNEATTLDAIKSMQALEQPGVLHLATHANFDQRSPEESYIYLWNEPLNMLEFSQLDWAESDLEMLILSACSTALSSRNSELGFAGLAAASGVDATVGSLWEVSDVGTLALMSEFYAQLEETDVRFEALRQAQLALLKGETRIEGGNLITGHGEVNLPAEWNLPDSATLDHPFFWSAFTMVGNPW